MKKNAYISGFLFAGLLLTIACQKDFSAEDLPPVETVQDHNLVLRFHPIVDTQALAFGDSYQNSFNEPYQVSAFKFYIHGIEMINADSGRVFRTNADKYWLVDFSDTNSTVIRLAILPYSYNRISFTVGVDSARNVSGAQTDALDPAKGMFWTWNSGYIMAKLEGNSPVSPGPAGKFAYHIGGFSGAENAIRKPLLLFPYAQLLDLKPGKTSELSISANVNAWFSNPHDIRLSANAQIMTPGALAVQVAENYTKMFTVDSVINE